jgi:hypothetical protein
MGKDALRYDQMVEEALRGVVRRALAEVAERGLPGAHHFYITFDTDHPGVLLSDTLRARYPEEMTIVLQHQFWGLEVEDTAFAVTLSFNDRQERIHVPLEAVTAFADPAVKFGLRFEAQEGAGATPPAPAPDQPHKDAKAEPDAAAEDGAKIVALDHFRKK